MDKKKWIKAYIDGINANRVGPSHLNEATLLQNAYRAASLKKPEHGYCTARLAKAGVEPYELGN